MNNNETTPQPKPADAAGLLPCPFCGKEAEACPGDSTYITCAGGCIFSLPRSQWNTRPLPTPHAAEAGVRDLPVAQEIADWAQENKELFFRHPAHVAHIAAILARHRTAAETAGTGTDVFFVAAASGLLYRDPKAAGDVAHVLVNGKPYYPTPPATQSASGAIAAVLDMAARGRTCGTLDVQKAQAELAATQSALEQVREALGVALWVERNGEAQSHAEGRPRLMQRLEIYRTALAALNAVLPPAKGGDGV